MERLPADFDALVEEHGAMAKAVLEHIGPIAEACRDALERGATAAIGEELMAPLDDAVETYLAVANSVGAIAREQLDADRERGSTDAVDCLLALAGTNLVLAGEVSRITLLEGPSSLAYGRLDEVQVVLRGGTIGGGSGPPSMRASCRRITDLASGKLQRVVAVAVVPTVHLHQLAHEIGQDVSRALPPDIASHIGSWWHHATRVVLKLLKKAHTLLSDLLRRAGADALVDYMDRHGTEIWARVEEESETDIERRVGGELIGDILHEDAVIDDCERYLGSGGLSDDVRRAAVERVAEEHAGRMRVVGWGALGLRLARAPVTVSVGPWPIWLGCAALAVATFWLAQDALDSTEPVPLPDLIAGAKWAAEHGTAPRRQ